MEEECTGEHDKGRERQRERAGGIPRGLNTCWGLEHEALHRPIKDLQAKGLEGRQMHLHRCLI